MSLKEMQAVYDYYGSDIYQYDGEWYTIKNKRICAGRYTVWLEPKS